MTDRGPRPGQGASRNNVRLALVVIAVAVASAAIGLGRIGTVPPNASSGVGAAASPPFDDLPLVTVAPTASPPASASPGDSGSGRPTASVTSEPERGIPATRIRVAQRGIDLAIIEGDGIDAPIGKAAHYPGSAWPGAGSNIYIYGHAREGMFITLWEIRVGDSIELELVDGTSRTYTVTDVLPKVPWDAIEYLAPTPTEQLTVQTSTSYYPTAPRFIVIAVPAS